VSPGVVGGVSVGVQVCVCGGGGGRVGGGEGVRVGGGYVLIGCASVGSPAVCSCVCSTNFAFGTCACVHLPVHLQVFVRVDV